jgi:uncharacterized protein (DUF58 family)
MALAVLAFLTREVIFAAVGAGILSTLASLGLIFQWRLGILRRALHVAQRLSKNKVFLGDSIDGELIIRNGSQLAAHVLAVQPVLEKALSFRLSSSFNRLLRPGTTSSSEFAITPLARGRFQISGSSLTLTDARGLFTGEVKYPQVDWVEVYPGMRTQAPLTPLRLYGGSTEIFRKAPTGMDYAGIREYVPGDEYHRVEWKATARLRTLMVKEFHPETQMTLRILIDTGRTMHQRSYVGTRLDEALTVAQLLVESAVGLGNHVGIWVYNEAGIAKATKPATAEEQLVTLRELALTLGAQAESKEPGTHVTPLRPSWTGRPNLPYGEQVSTFMRLLKLKLRLGYRNSGIFKALTEATDIGLEGFFIILTDLQTDNGMILETVSNWRQRGRIIVVQIGAAWRLSCDLEEAYARHESNSRALQRLQHLGLAVFDSRPERLIETIAQHLSKSTAPVRLGQ